MNAPGHAPLIFSPPQRMEKIAGYKMPQNPRLWQAEIIRYLKSQHPYLPLENAEIDLRRLDAAKGAAVGSVILDNEVAIPIIISRPRPGAEPELSPMDVFFHQGAYKFLDSDTIRHISHTPQIGEPEKGEKSRAVGGNPYVGDMTGDATPLEYSGQASPFAGPFDGTKTSSLWLPEEMVKEALSDKAKEHAAQGGVLFGLTGAMRGVGKGATEGKGIKDRLAKALIGGAKGAAGGAAIGSVAGAATPAVRKSLGIAKKQRRRERRSIKSVVQRELEKASEFTRGLESVVDNGITSRMLKTAYLDPNDLANFRQLMATNPQVLQGSGHNHRLMELVIRRGPTKPAAQGSKTVGPNIVQVFQGPMGGTYIKFSGGPEKRTDDSELKKIFGDRYREVSSKLRSGDVFMQHDGVQKASWDAIRPRGESKAITGDGFYAVNTKGREVVVGMVCPTMFHFDGRELPLKLLITPDGRYAISGEMFGIKLADKHRLPSQPPSAGQTGVFVNYVHGTPISTPPLRLKKITNTVVDNGQKSMKIYQVQDPTTGEIFALSPAEGVQGFERMWVHDKTSDAAFGQASEIYYMPAGVEWVSLRDRVEVANSESELQKLSSVPDHTHVTCDGSLFNVHDSRIENGVDLHDFEVRELLVSMGSEQDGAEEIMKQAAACTGEDRGVRIGGLHEPQSHGEFEVKPLVPVYDEATIKFASECRPSIGLLKAAAQSGHPETLDSILSLEFITPQNIRYFLDNIPDFEETASRLAALLIAQRLGMKHVDEQPVKDALEGMSKTVSKLKILKSAIEAKNERPVSAT